MKNEQYLDRPYPDGFFADLKDKLNTPDQAEYESLDPVNQDARDFLEANPEFELDEDEGELE